MSSKPKTKNYIVLHNGQAFHGGYTTLGRYKVGARNEKEAEDFLKELVGKHTKVKVYYEVKESVTLLPHGAIAKEC